MIPCNASATPTAASHDATTIESRIDSLWNAGLTEREIAAALGISQYAVLCARRGKLPMAGRAGAGSPKPLTETRIATSNGWGGHRTCRHIPVTLAYSGTIAA